MNLGHSKRLAQRLSKKNWYRNYVKEENLEIIYSFLDAIEMANYSIITPKFKDVIKRYVPYENQERI